MTDLTISFFDTMARELRPLTTDGNSVRIYSCGPTVYRRAHIGNMRTYVMPDILRRAIHVQGSQTRQVVNITDVGHMTDDVNDEGQDRMMLAVEDEGLTPEEIAAKYTEAFLRDAALLNIMPADVYPKATDHIEEMIDIIRVLIEKGHAYEKDGTVYFDVASFPAYGSLSHNTIEKLQQGHRIEGVDPAKKAHYDFTLWRSAGSRRLMSWESPWGSGYPGWHIECSAMSLKHLGERFEVHTGGSDNIFPHHEDEIAQSEGYLGHTVVDRWLHGHHLLADGRKMAKSAGNYYVIDDVIERGFDPLALRYLILQVRYRSQMNFTWDALEAAQRGLTKIRNTVASWGPAAAEVETPEALRFDRAFASSIAVDLDTPQALTVLSSLISSDLRNDERAYLVRRWDLVLGLELASRVTKELPPGAGDLIESRDRARAAGDFDQADRIRDQLQSLGVTLEDAPEGTRWIVSDGPN